MALVLRYLNEFEPNARFCSIVSMVIGLALFQIVIPRRPLNGKSFKSIRADALPVLRQVEFARNFL